MDVSKLDGSEPRPERRVNKEDRRAQLRPESHGRRRSDRTLWQRQTATASYAYSALDDEHASKVELALRQGWLQQIRSSDLRAHLQTLASDSRDVGHREVVQGLVLTHLLVERQIARLARRAALQYVVVGALAAGALVFSVAAVVTALLK